MIAAVDHNNGSSARAELGSDQRTLLLSSHIKIDLKNVIFKASELNLTRLLERLCMALANAKEDYHRTLFTGRCFEKAVAFPAAKPFRSLVFQGTKTNSAPVIFKITGAPFSIVFIHELLLNLG